MRQILFAFVLSLAVVTPAFAQTSRLGEEDVATTSSDATQSATTSGIVEKVVEKKSDLTEPTSEAKSKLERVLEEHPAGELRWDNPLRYLIFQSVRQGVPVNTIVLVLLFPVVAALVVASRHLVGLRGLGIFTPSLLAIGFLATGISVGVVMFVTILVVATVARVLLRKLKLQYLPRMAILLWLVSFGVFGTIVAAGYVGYGGLVTVGIFPILILMLLAESFIDVQVGRSFREASSLMTSTFLLAIATSYVIGLEAVQRSVLLYPEVVFLGVGLFDFFMAKYVGLRVVEYLKFRPVLAGSGDDEE